MIRLMLFVDSIAGAPDNVLPGGFLVTRHSVATDDLLEWMIRVARRIMRVMPRKSYVTLSHQGVSAWRAWSRDFPSSNGGASGRRLAG
jgi:hypothetical protein